MLWSWLWIANDTDQLLFVFALKLNIPTKVYDTEHFYSTRTELSDLFVGKKTYLMETFYRHMRKKHKVLLDDENKPLHGKWNFDEDNRSKLPKAHKPIIAFVFSVIAFLIFSILILKSSEETSTITGFAPQCITTLAV